MKKILLVFACAIFALPSFSQKRGNNTMIIKVQTEAKQTYIDFLKHLLTNGFTFDQRDEELLYFVTGIKAPPKGKPNYRIKAFFLDTHIRIEVEWQYYSWETGSTGPLVWRQWFYKKGGVMKDIYKGFYPILKSFNPTITFTTL